MKRLLFLTNLLSLAASLTLLETTLLQTKALAQAPEAPPAAAADPHRAILNTYCVGCHNTRAKTGGLALDSLNLQAAADDAQIWEKALRKLRGDLMPPPGSPQPPQKDVDSFVDWMENPLDSQAKGPKAGYVPIQRRGSQDMRRGAAGGHLAASTINARLASVRRLTYEAADSECEGDIGPSDYEPIASAGGDLSTLTRGWPEILGPGSIDDAANLRCVAP